MSAREYAIKQLDILPDETVEKVLDFISYQIFLCGLYDSDSDYLSSIPGMSDKIREGLSAPISECVPLSEVWAYV